MSGTSLDGVDGAIIETDGNRIFDFGPHLTLPYEANFRENLRAVLGLDVAAPELVRELTALHAQAVEALLAQANLMASDIDIIGFHGQTIFHDADQNKTVQIGDGKLLAEMTGVSVINDFRSNDVAAGGQGAPFAPVYHQALTADMAKPVAVLNIGGVANVTWIDEESILAFDTGPGNALMDDWVKKQTGADFDGGGALAATGEIDGKILDDLMNNDYFPKSPPKSLDRNDFSIEAIDPLEAADGAATLAAFTVETIAKAQSYFPKPVAAWIVCGGGRLNDHLMASLEARLGQKLLSSEGVGWRGDAIEAQAFAFMAVRSLLDLPISYPTTTGVPVPQTGGRLHRV